MDTCKRFLENFASQKHVLVLPVILLLKDISHHLYIFRSSSSFSFPAFSGTSLFSQPHQGAVPGALDFLRQHLTLAAVFCVKYLITAHPEQWLMITLICFMWVCPSGNSPWVGSSVTLLRSSRCFGSLYVLLEYPGF